MLTAKFIGLIAIIYLFMEAEPIEWIKKFLLVSNQTKALKEWHMALITLVNCSLCTGFWVGLFFYHDIYLAATLSFSAELVHCLMRKLNNTLS